MTGMTRAWLKRALYVVVIALLVYALSQFDAHALLDSLRQIPLWTVLFLIGAQIVTQLLLNLQWFYMARLTGAAISFGKMLYINCQGAVVESITPGAKIGGEVTRAVQLCRLGKCPCEQSAAVVALQKLFSLGAFFFLCLLAISFLTNKTPLLQSGALQLFIFGLLVLSLALFVIVLAAPGKIEAHLLSKKPARFTWQGRLVKFVETLLGQIVSIRASGKTLTGFVLLSVLIWLMYPLKMYVLAAQIMPGVSLAHIAAIAFVAYMAAMLPIFPGGLGGFEGASTLLLLPLGFAQCDALALTVIFRFITFWLVMLLSAGYIKVWNS